MQGSTFELVAAIRVVTLQGEPYVCNSEVEGCPHLGWRTDDRSRWNVLADLNPVVSADGFQYTRAELTINEDLAKASQPQIFIRMYRKDLKMIVDNVSFHLTNHVTREPTNAPTTVPTAQPTLSPTRGEIVFEPIDPKEETKSPTRSPIVSDLVFDPVDNEEAPTSSPTSSPNQLVFATSEDETELPTAAPTLSPNQLLFGVADPVPEPDDPVVERPEQEMPPFLPIDTTVDDTSGSLPATVIPYGLFVSAVWLML